MGQTYAAQGMTVVPTSAETLLLFVPISGVTGFDGLYFENVRRGERSSNTLI